MLHSAAELDPIEFSWTSSDVQLYHLGLGAGADPMDPRELRYLVDDTPQVLPTFGNVAATFHATKPPTVKFPGIDIELGKVLHASEQVSVPGAASAVGFGKAVTRFTDIWDKGKAAVIWSRDRRDRAGRHAAVDAEAVDLRPRRRRLRWRAGALEVGRPRRTGHPISSWTSRAAAAGAALPALRRPQPAAFGSRIRRCRRVSPSDPARLVHLRHDLQGARRRFARRGRRRRRAPTAPASPAWPIRAKRSRPPSGRKTAGCWPASLRPPARTRWCSPVWSWSRLSSGRSRRT